MPKRNYPTSKPLASLFRRFVFGFGALSAALAALFAADVSSRALPVMAEEDAVPWTPNESEKLVERKELAVTAVSSTLTSTAQSVSVTFRSKKIEAWANGARYKNVFVLPDDEAWTKENALAQYKTDKEEADAKGEEVELRHYPSSVYNIAYNRNSVAIDGRRDIMVIPSTITRNAGFVLDVQGISQDCCFSTKTDQVSYENIAEIIIPETVTYIASGAFYDVPEDVKIRCEAPATYINEDGEEVPTYDTDWTDATPEYDYELTEDQVKALNVATPSPEEFGDGADFFLGIQNEDFNLPVYMEYQLEELSGGEWKLLNEKYMHPIPIQSINNPYDGVGSSMGESYLNQNVSIDVPANCRINSESIIFHNIYRARELAEGETYSTRMVPDVKTGEADGWNGEYYAEPAIAFTLVPHFEEFYSMTPLSYATLANFLQLEVEFTRQKGDTGYGIYPELEPSLFQQNKAALDAGTLQVRYQFSSLDQAKYRFFLKDGSYKELRVATPIKYVLMPDAKAYRTGFLIDLSSTSGLRVEDIQKVEFSNFGIKADLYKPETNSIVTKSSISMRFANLVLFEDITAARHINVNLFIGLAYLIYAVAFLIIAVAYYFIAKKIYRNDEFRRMNTKKYLLATLKNFLGFAFIFSAILFIYCRWGLMRTTIVVFNPLDAFVAAFTVVGAIYLGFTIRNLVVSFKNARTRKEALRLKLDQDQDDDGTK